MTISHSILAAAKAGERAVESTEQQRQVSDLIVKVPGGDWGPLGVEPSRNAVSPASTPRLCKDCKHAEAGAGVWYCNQPELLALDFVTGNHKAQHCATLRAPGAQLAFTRYCMPEGQFWEAK